MGHEVLLEFEKLTKRFPGLIAVKDADLKIRAGEVHSIVGGNGAGKSTLMKMLSGIYPYGTYEGTIRLLGKECQFKNILEAQSAGISLIPQDINMANEMTVGENLFMSNFPTKRGFVDYDRMYRETREILAEFELDVSPTAKVKEIGVAQKQLITIARAMHNDVKVLLLDEPTSTLSDKECKILFEKVRMLKDKGITCRAGVLFYDLEVQGKKSHAGGMPEAGRNAIEELAHKISRVHQINIPNAFLHTTLIKGGVSEGMVPDYAWAHVDVRVDTMEACEEVKKAMRRIEGDDCIQGTKTTIRQRQGGCYPMIRVPEQDKFCNLINAVSAEAGHPLREAFCGGGANAVISAMAGTPTIDGVTPTSGCWHTEEEYLELSSMVSKITILAETIRRICQEDQYLKANPHRTRA